MKRKINFTNRQRITADLIEVGVLNDAKEGALIVADLSAVGDRYQDDFDPNSHVVIDVKGARSFKRFSFGSISHITLPLDASLAEFADVSSFTAMAKVIDPEEGLIIAESANMTLTMPSEGEIESATDRELMTLDLDESLDERWWAVGFNESEPRRVYLRVNKRLPGADQLSHHKPPAFLGMVTAAAMQLALIKLWIVDGQTPDSDDALGDWSRLLESFYEPVPDEEPQIDEKWAWIERAIDAFCAQHRMRTNYGEHFEGGRS
jgi:hypothetical protein